MKKQKNTNHPNKGKNQQKQHDKQNEQSENQEGYELPNVESDENTNF